MAASLALKLSREVRRPLLGGIGNNLSSVLCASNEMTACNFLSQQRTFTQMGTVPNAVDNSGTKRLMYTQALKGEKVAGLGDGIDASVKEAVSNVRRSLLGGLGNNLSSLLSMSNEMTARNFLSQQRTFIQMGTVLNIVDNSGTKRLMSTQALKGEKGAELGDSIDSGNPSFKVIQRPLSPHLSVYKPQLTSTMSIFNRIAGVFLTVVVLFYYLLFLKLPSICFTYESFYRIFEFFFDQDKLIIISEITALALTYHLYKTIWVSMQGRPFGAKIPRK
ncbi:uncharacterized protein LOC123204607 isoform X2 [Mangifera indica]|uniref:uncharacterized protein LOC123204607 isoform X2 n=1 Tax=Mangifera indica TaxID=29780 RepID=UPI001CFA1E4A|nr:uncharacterized protein LOC123204607 isoform X2 [Mangifera indica]